MRSPKILPFLTSGLEVSFCHLFIRILFVPFVLGCCLISSSLYAQPAGFVDEVYISGFQQAVGLAFDENSRMYVWEKGGKVWIVENGVKSTNPLIDLTEEVGNWRDFGLLGFALDPNFLTNGYIYLLYIVDRHHLMNFGTPSYNPNSDDYFDATIGRVTRYTAEASTNFTTVDLSSRLVLLGESPGTGLPHLHQSHGIGSLVFGTDGTLLVSMGDGASYNSTDEGSASETYYSQALIDGIITTAENVGAYRSQMLDSHNGKILRLDPATGDGLPSNPFYNASEPRSPRSRVWALGLRNPCRMTLEPESGSHDPTDGDPGVLYIGDVGWSSREELNICNAPGQNFGWPRYEGADYTTGYSNSAFFPAVHTLPKAQWRNGQTAKAVVDGTIYNIGSSQVPGPSFVGNCSIGGVFYTGTTFPSEYHNTYFHADYGGDWIQNFLFDNNQNPTQVKSFKTGANALIFVGVDPIDGSMYWIGDANGNSNNEGNAIHRITYNPTGNLKPVAKAESDVHFGAGPLTVNFDSRFSYDPENTSLTYLWDFGDGNTSTAAAPSHIFSPATTTPATFNVSLTVTDGAGQSATDNLEIYVNNTPPQILSTSVDGLSTFSHTNTTTVNLSATVSDAEHSAGQLSYTWQTALYHNNHHHNDPPVNATTSSAILSPVGCDGVTYWYRVSLTVSDPTGLSSTFTKDLYPDCAGTSQTINFPSISDQSPSAAPFPVSAAASSGLPVSLYLMDGPAILTGNILTLNGVPGKVTIRAVQGGDQTTFQPALPVEQSFDVFTNGGGGTGGQFTTTSQVSTSSDDAEENINSGNVKLNSSDLELTFDNADQLVGIRFTNLNIPQGATIQNAAIQFTTDETSTGISALMIRGELNGNAPTFSATSGNISSRSATSTAVSWSPPDWNTVGEASGGQKTPDISAIIQEIVNLPGWTTSSSLVILMEGSGRRAAEAYDGTSSSAPELTVDYSTGSGPGGNQSPTASISVNNQSGTVPLTVNFDGSSSNDPDGTIVSYAWDFGDGNTATGSTASHTYNTDGTFLATLTVTDDSSATGNSSVNITVNPQVNDLPTASITTNTTSGLVPLTVSFDGSGSIDTDGSIVSYAWDFGDGNSATGVTANHTYNSDGTFQVTLTVTDNEGGTGTGSVNITVNPVPNDPPVAGLSTNVTSGVVPLNVSFDGTSSSDTDGTIVSYDWDFGDGNSATGSTVNHTYNSTGVYLATLTVMDDDGDMDDASVSITVTNAAGTITVNSQISDGDDDAEENTRNGAMSLRSSDLELAEDGNKDQIVGMRFNNLNIPQGALIQNAWIQFTVDESRTGSSALTIRGESSDNAQTFVNSGSNISSRPATVASVPWSAPNWTVVGQAGSAQQTPDISAVVQEIVDRTGWTTSSSMVIMIDGTGRRAAEAYNGSPSDAPVLHVDYLTGAGARLARESQHTLNVNLYPNPFTNYFFLEIESPDSELVEVSMVDVTGKSVFESREVPTNGKFKIEKALPAGVYFVRITNGGIRKDFKVMKVD